MSQQVRSGVWKKQPLPLNLSVDGLRYEITLVSDAHTTQSKPHADAAQIIDHHNATLSSIKSFGVRIQALQTAAVDFNT